LYNNQLRGWLLFLEVDVNKINICHGLHW